MRVLCARVGYHNRRDLRLPLCHPQPSPVVILSTLHSHRLCRRLCSAQDDRVWDRRIFGIFGIFRSRARTTAEAADRSVRSTRAVAKSMIYKDLSCNSFKIKDLEEIPPKSLTLKDRPQGVFRYRPVNTPNNARNRAQNSTLVGTTLSTPFQYLFLSTLPETFNSQSCFPIPASNHL